MSAQDVFHSVAINPLRNSVFHATADAGAAAANKDWQMWVKPQEATFVHIWMVGAGGGGGGGFTGAASSARGGGGGGGSGAIARGTFLASMLPDILYVQVPQGGTGSTGSGVAGGVGGRVHVSVRPSVTAADIVLVSGAADASGGAAGSGAIAGAGGTASTVSTAISGSFGSLATSLQFTAGDTGTAGGAQTGAAGSPQVALASINITGGAGGAGVTTTDFNGGAIVGAGICPSRVGGTANANGEKALNGYMSWIPLFSTGGSGGGSDNDAIGGTGGDGGIGSGGGGGGGGATGGGGGRGGDGYCVITVF
jgi:hypothetical protein